MLNWRVLIALKQALDLRIVSSLEEVGPCSFSVVITEIVTLVSVCLRVLTLAGASEWTLSFAAAIAAI